MAGLREKRKNKIKVFAFAILAIFICVAVSSFTGVDHVNKYETAGMGLSALPIGLAMLQREADPGQGGGDAEKAALLKEIKGLIDEAKKGNATKEELKAIQDKYDELVKSSEKLKDYTPEQIKAYFEEHASIMGKIKAMEENPKNNNKTYKTKIEAIKASLEENIDVIKGAFDSKGNLKSPIVIEMKAITMQEDNTIGAGPTQYTITSNTGIISVIRKRAEVYLANVSVGSLTGNQALWIEELDEDGTPIMLGEGDAATQLSVRYEERTKDVKEISVYGKVTNRMLEDLSMLASYINNNLEKRMDLKVEDQLFSGDDTGDNLAGFDEYAVDFDAGDSAGTVQMPNEWDVLEAIATQVELAHGIANAVFVNPRTIQSMKARKTSTGEPVWKMYQDSNSPTGLSVGGMRIISSTAITAGDFKAGDLSVLNVLFRQNTTIQIGTDGNDLIQRKKTVVYTKRLVQFASANDVAVLVKGDFNSAIADLNLV